MSPLTGCRVIDFGQGVAGPYCSMLLGDFGAEIIKVEPMRGDWSRSMGTRTTATESTTYLSVNRNKKSICLDLSQDEGRSIAARLISTASVVVESFRPGVMERLGLGFEAVREHNRSLIYCSITGFGDDGPYATRPAGDSTMQAIGGLMSIIGEADGPPLRVGNVVSDMLAGMHGFEAVLLAMLNRNSAGEGSHVKVNLFETILAFQAPPLTEYLLTGALPQKTGNAHPLIAPSGMIETADKPIIFTVLQHQWDRFCNFLGMPDLAEDERFCSNEDRLRNRPALMEIIGSEFAGEASAGLLDRLRKADILCAPVNSYDDIACDPQVLLRNVLRNAHHETMGDIPYVANPIRLGGDELGVTAPPTLGEHTTNVLSQALGLLPDEIEQLVRTGVVGV